MKKPCDFCYGIFACKLGKADYNDAEHLITAKHHNSPQANITKKDLVISDKVFFLVTRTRIDRLLRILMARRPNALHSVPASPLFAKIDSLNQFLYAKTLSSSILQDIKKNKEYTSVYSLFFGDPDENRTRVTAVKGRCLNLLTTGPGQPELLLRLKNGSGSGTRTYDTPGMNRML